MYHLMIKTALRTPFFIAKLQKRESNGYANHTVTLNSFLKSDGAFISIFQKNAIRFGMTYSKLRFFCLQMKRKEGLAPSVTFEVSIKSISKRDLNIAQSLMAPAGDSKVFSTNTRPARKESCWFSYLHSFFSCSIYGWAFLSKLLPMSG